MGRSSVTPSIDEEPTEVREGVKPPGFWRRFAAWALDATLLFALMIPFLAGGLFALDSEWATVTTIGVLVGWYGYKIVTQALWGKTIGKRALRICLRVGAGAPTWWSVVLRYAPGVLFGGVHVAWWTLMIRSIGRDELQHMTAIEQHDALTSSDLYALSPLFSLSIAGWLVLNVIVLLASRENRAIHDLIAGTTVRRFGK